MSERRALAINSSPDPHGVSSLKPDHEHEGKLADKNNVEFFSSGRDYYRRIAFFQIALFVYSYLFFYRYGFENRSVQGVAELSGRVKLIFVVATLTLMMLSILLERFVYLKIVSVPLLQTQVEKLSVRKALKRAKLIYHIIQLVVIQGILIYFYTFNALESFCFSSPSVSLTSNPPQEITTTDATCKVNLLVFYGLYWFYFYFSALQLREGYPLQVGLKYNENYSDFDYTTFKIFRAVPLLAELRVSLDWIISHTSLSLGQWWKADSIHAILVEGHHKYGRKRSRTKSGEVSRCQKLTTACFFALTLILIFIGPYFLAETYYDLVSLSEADEIFTADMKLVATNSEFENLTWLYSQQSDLSRGNESRLFVPNNLDWRMDSPVKRLALFSGSQKEPLWVIDGQTLTDRLRAVDSSQPSCYENLQVTLQSSNQIYFAEFKKDSLQKLATLLLHSTLANCERTSFQLEQSRELAVVPPDLSINLSYVIILIIVGWIVRVSTGRIPNPETLRESPDGTSIFRMLQGIQNARADCLFEQEAELYFTLIDITRRDEEIYRLTKSSLSVYAKHKRD
mmetsp:Transcript_11116/g.12184  ORF Transcript_11116/g.12184 Transcript_11116/m.12184 type:complete len:569 (-) Transcript_11116:116-1822(-)